MKKKSQMHIPFAGNSKVVHTVEMHTGGEPLQIVTDGIPEIPGKTILEKQKHFMENHDTLRKSLILEPRGHRDMYGAIITKPVTEDADFGVFFLHNEGYSTMCGHAIIALTKFALETALVVREGDHPEIRIDTPAGLITATGFREASGIITSCSFRNVPLFVLLMDSYCTNFSTY